MPNLKEISVSYLKAGLSVLPANVDRKFAALSGWKEYQQRLPYDSEIQSWFSGSADGLCIVTGKVSGNLEMIDFDIAAEMFEPWQSIVKKESPDLLTTLVIEKSQSGGRHVIYRCEEEICKSLKLAKRKIIVVDNAEVTFCGKTFKPIQDKDGSWFILPTYIETRGEGGLFLCAPTLGYELIQNDFTKIPVISPEQRDILLSAALSLNEYTPEPIQPTQTISTPAGNLRPGDDYNTNGDIREVCNHSQLYGN